MQSNLSRRLNVVIDLHDIIVQSDTSQMLMGQRNAISHDW